MASVLRKVRWYFKGSKEYTKSGYEKACKNFNAADLDVDATGKSFMITGANSGVGKATAQFIAQKGGTVHMVCRSKQRGEEALNELKAKSSNQEIYLHELDLSDLPAVAKFAQEFQQSGKTLNVLVNNAGCMINQLEKTADGIEKNFATNTLGTYLLTKGLIPVLRQQPKSRVVTVTSGGMLTEKLNHSNPQLDNVAFSGIAIYAQNKRQQVVMTEEWAEQYPDIHFSCTHPGWADTPAVQMSMPEFYESNKHRLRSVEEGADTMVWLCLADCATSFPSGEFYQDRKIEPKHLYLGGSSSSKSDQQQFMKKIAELVAKY
ncbi:dehydrogenase/reductase SDR family member 12-like [Tubulanus polymorphus]|uniref:dehydrogenase/reductase SDR family member 12-like n=1 Tax=Tubulanus polymorphus TaxID=672921 RepID=UPI003DA2DC28